MQKVVLDGFLLEGEDLTIACKVRQPLFWLVYQEVSVEASIASNGWQIGTMTVLDRGKSRQFHCDYDDKNGVLILDAEDYTKSLRITAAFVSEDDQPALRGYVEGEEHQVVRDFLLMGMVLQKPDPRRERTYDKVELAVTGVNAKFKPRHSWDEL